MQVSHWLVMMIVTKLLALATLASETQEQVFYLNTSNNDKLKEYREYLPGYKIMAKKTDLAEPLADELTVIQYKASQLDEGYLVDDASLHVQGVEIGVNIKWLIPKLHEHEGKIAEFSCLLGVRKGDEILIFKGSVNGKIVKPKGEGFGIGPFFLPDGLSRTLGEYMAPKYNPRYLALQNFLEKNVYETRPLLTQWTGEFQNQ